MLTPLFVRPGVTTHALRYNTLFGFSPFAFWTQNLSGAAHAAAAAKSTRYMQRDYEMHLFSDHTGTCSLITLPIGSASQSTCSGSCALAGGLRRSTSHTAASSCFCHGAVLTVADACHSPVSLLGRLICAFDAHALVPKPATLPRQHRCLHQHYRPMHQLQFFRTKRQTLPSTRIPLI